MLNSHDRLICVFFFYDIYTSLSYSIILGIFYGSNSYKTGSNDLKFLHNMNEIKWMTFKRHSYFKWFLLFFKLAQNCDFRVRWFIIVCKCNENCQTIPSKAEIYKKTVTYSINKIAEPFFYNFSVQKKKLFEF